MDITCGNGFEGRGGYAWGVLARDGYSLHNIVVISFYDGGMLPFIRSQQGLRMCFSMRAQMVRAPRIWHEKTPALASRHSLCDCTWATSASMRIG